MPVKLNGFTVGYAAAGAIILWSGVKGWTLSDTFTYLTHPGSAQPVNSQSVGVPQLNINDQAGGGSGAGSQGALGTTNSNIANDALSYVGNKYVWGGTPGTATGHDAGTDCSGFVNMVVGRDLSGAIPGYSAGQYKGATHGPVTGAWLFWGGATTIPRSQVQAGDLACWQTHIAIFTDNGNNVVSALDTASGVKETTVAGATPTGEVLVCRRIKNVPGSNQKAQYGGTLAGGGY